MSRFRMQDFKCKDCEKITEILLDRSEVDQECLCEHCGSANLENQISVGSGNGTHISWSKWRAQQ